jgi:membrane protein
LTIRLGSTLEESRGGRFAIDCLRAARAVARGFRGEKISLRASALTYLTMLSLVPLLAVGFAIIRALGQESLRRAVHDFVFANLAPGAREQIGEFLDRFIARASSGAMGGLGGVFLLASAVMLLHNIERSLNEIWGMSRPRPLLQRVLVYWGVLTLGPVVLGLSLLASSGMRSFLVHGAYVPNGALTVVPIATTIVLLTLLYLVGPNARVSFRSALGGAIVAGVAWEMAKQAYALYAAKSIRYSAIYGSLGAVPLFLLWVYLSWLLVLFGARLAYALQHASLSGLHESRMNGARSRELLCARVALSAAVEYLNAAEPPSPWRISKELGIDVGQIAEAVRALKQGGLLAEASAGGVVPARPPEQIRLVDIARAARGTFFDRQGESPIREAGMQALGRLFAEADRQGKEALGRVDLASLARPLARVRSADRGTADSEHPRCKTPMF